MELTTIDEDYRFITHSFNKVNIHFSTAYNGLNFNLSSEEGKENLENIKKWFKVKEIGYLNQVHSDLVYNFDGEKHQGDALITEKKGVAIGVFTADCVPIMLFDSEKEVIAAVHSGWKGTYLNIVSKVLNKMKFEYGCKAKNIRAIIGPHNMQCCYNVGEDLKEKFLSIPLFQHKDIMNKEKLNLQECIKIQLLSENIDLNNIIFNEVCTYCNGELPLHSYRKSKENAGRMFSFIYMS